MARSYRRVALHRRVVVNLDTGNAIAGILWDESGPLLVLKDATLLTQGGSAPMDGESVVVERARISFVQVVS